MTTSAGDPHEYTTHLLEAGITVFQVVGTLRSALKAADAGVDGLIVEGVVARAGAVHAMVIPVSHAGGSVHDPAQILNAIVEAAR